MDKDFIDYVRENDFYPIEVTMDRNLKKELDHALDRTLDDMAGCYELCEDGLDEAGEGCWIIPGGFEVEAQLLDVPESQGTYVPEDVELRWIVSELKDRALEESWREYYGQMMFVTRHHSMHRPGTQNCAVDGQCR